VAEIDQVYEFARSLLQVAVGTWVFHAKIAPFRGLTPDETIRDKSKADVELGLTTVNSTLFKTNPNFAVGDSFTIVDVFFAAFLSHLELIEFDFAPYPAVDAYYKHLIAQPAVASVYNRFKATIQAAGLKKN